MVVSGTDLNYDGAVNILDIGIWQDSYGIDGGGDTDGDGDTDGRDFLKLQRHLDTPITLIAVPEPSPAALIFFGLFLLTNLRKMVY